MPYMQMSGTIQQRLEEAGIRVLRTSFDFRMKTDLFIQLPDGRTLGYYDYLHQIPDTLYNGEEISIGENAIPPEAPTIQTNEAGSCSNASCGTIWDGDSLSIGSSLVIPPAFIALIIFLIKLIAVFIVIYLILQKILHPCGQGATQTDIDQCFKVVTYPDCSTITIDSCAVDEQGNPHPKVVNQTSPPIEDWLEIVKWIVVGAIALAGVYIAAKVIPSLFKRKPEPPPYHHPPPEET